MAIAEIFQGGIDHIARCFRVAQVQGPGQVQGTVADGFGLSMLVIAML